MYPPLWTSLHVGMTGDTENTSILWRPRVLSIQLFFTFNNIFMLCWTRSIKRTRTKNCLTNTSRSNVLHNPPARISQSWETGAIFPQKITSFAFVEIGNGNSKPGPAKYFAMNQSAGRSLTQFWQPFTVIDCPLKDLKR